MPIKNYTTRMPVAQSVAKIQQNLVDHGAIGFMMQYEKGTGRIEALRFSLDYNGQPLNYSVPVDWRKFQAVLREQKVPRCEDEDYCYRVCWADIRDWIDAQMALYETEIVKIEQIFLPYMTDNKGKTFFEKFEKNQLLLEDKN